MKLHITVGGEFDSVFEYEDDAETGTDLTAEELKALVTLWLMAATDSAQVTQSVLDAITDRLKNNSDALKAAVDAIVR
jgi:hypothetical protein